MIDYIPETLQPMQVVLIGMLAVMLLIWMVLFTWLAIRPDRVARSIQIEPVMTPALSSSTYTVMQNSLPALATNGSNIPVEASREIVLER